MPRVVRWRRSPQLMRRFVDFVYSRLPEASLVPGVRYTTRNLWGSQTSLGISASKSRALSSIAVSFRRPSPAGGSRHAVVLTLQIFGVRPQTEIELLLLHGSRVRQIRWPSSSRSRRGQFRLSCLRRGGGSSLASP